ncbi:hypothetical protein RHSIM_Rhsim08G0112800 [Rhododendron simsii]|uniref:BZIP domain-containing protein n=1 Tax=Rhododendron simsii TaxID=118357 RepID=A0A834GHX7_RHOSS|nr:hypothetical protein RHSIM_Rhsim08G0112800 [Rhododendron simsii]
MLQYRSLVSLLGHLFAVEEWAPTSSVTVLFSVCVFDFCSCFQILGLPAHMVYITGVIYRKLPQRLHIRAYYGAGAPPFYATTAASPSPHPYMWGSQHPFIPPYGTPVPYPPLYAPGGVYAGPNMAMVPNMGQTNVALEGNVPSGKDPGANKKSKGTSRNTGLIGGKGGENGKEASGSGYDGATQSAESGSEGSSDASDENNSQEYAGIASKKGSFDQMLEDGANAQNKAAGPNLQASVPGNSVVSSVPAANVNMGMDLWSASPAGAEAVKMRPGPPGVGTTVAPATLAGREGIRTNQWTQDDRELKRQKRKQSNRESARRSRLRKQQTIVAEENTLSFVTKKACYDLNPNAEDAEDIILTWKLLLLTGLEELVFGSLRYHGIRAFLGYHLSLTTISTCRLLTSHPQPTPTTGDHFRPPANDDCPCNLLGFFRLHSKSPGSFPSALEPVWIRFSEAECEELQERVDKLNNENCTLRDELQRLSAECEKLTSENNYIKSVFLRGLGVSAAYSNINVPLEEVDILDEFEPNLNSSPTSPEYSSSVVIVGGANYATALNGYDDNHDEGVSVSSTSVGSLVRKDERESLVSTEYGEISAVEISDIGSTRRRRRGRYQLQFITLEPNALFLPVLLHRDMVFYVHTGSGRLSWVDEGEMRRVNLQQGDVYRLPTGSVFFLQSNLEQERQKLRIYSLFTNSIQDLHEPSVGAAAYSSIPDLVLGFEEKTLQAAFNVTEEVIEEIRSGTTPQAIVHAPPKKGSKLWQFEAQFMKVLLGSKGNSIFDIPNKKTKTFNILKAKPDFQNGNGKSLMGSMMGPHWNPMGSEISIVTQGRGIVRVVCSSSMSESECKNTRFRVEEGDVFVVPRFHPMAQMAFNDDSLIFVGFSTTTKKNHPQFLVGKASVLQTLDKDIVAASFNVTNTTISQLLAAQGESIILECTSWKRFCPVGCQGIEEALQERKRSNIYPSALSFYLPTVIKIYAKFLEIIELVKIQYNRTAAIKKSLLKTESKNAG